MQFTCVFESKGVLVQVEEESTKLKRFANSIQHYNAFGDDYVQPR